MIETIMYAAIGFLSATLLALITLPAVWRRAVRLTRRRIEAAIPISVAEFLADKDQMRASFALETRRQEMDIGDLRHRTAEQWAQISRLTEKVRQGEISLEETTAELHALQSRHVELVQHDQHISTELASRTQALEETTTRLTDLRRQLAEERVTLEASLSQTDGLKVENAALTTLRDTLTGRVADLEHRLARTTAMLEEDRLSLRNTSENLTREQASTRDLTGRLSLSESSLAAVTSQSALTSAELAALKISAQALEKRAAELEKERDDTRAEAERHSLVAADYQRAAESATRKGQDRAAMLQAEKAMLEGALAKAREERNELQARLDAGAPAQPSIPVLEDAGLLRENLANVAAQVAQITAALEGPASPITQLLATGSRSGKKAGAEPTLAERILALQEKATQDLAAREMPAPAPARRKRAPTAKKSEPDLVPSVPPAAE